MVNALTSARLEVATDATEAREILRRIRPSICLSTTDRGALVDIDDLLCGIINRAMRVE